jgi:U3 small nucleolar RNA-associated protein 4
METVLFAGVADGTIRRYDVHLKASPSTNNDDDDVSIQVEKMTSTLRMTVESKGRRIPTKIWCLKILQDGTVVSGNSLGRVQFWDGATGTLQKSIQQNEFQADVLQLVVSKDEHKVFASGVDSRVICLERQRQLEQEPHESSSLALTAQNPWLLTHAQRPHTHDVKAMTLLGNDTLVTGGVDTKICTYLVQEFSKKRPQVWYPWPSFSPVTGVAARMLVMQRDSQVDLFRLESNSSSSTSTTLPRESSLQLGTIQVDSQSNLVASCISTDGNYLAVCDAASLFVFQLTFNRETSTDGTTTMESVIPQKIELPATLVSCPYVALHFTSATQLLAATASGNIQVLNLDTMEASLLSPPTPPSPSSDNSWHLPIHSMHTSPNGAFVASLSHSQQDAIHVYSKDGPSGYRHCWKLPNLSARPSALTFLPDSKQLAVATSSSAVYIFDLVTQKLAPWSEEQGFPLQTLPNELANRKEYPLRLSVNPSDPTKLIMVRT